MRVLFASRNAGKQREAAAILQSETIDLVFPNDFPQLGSQEPAETGDTFTENALLKAEWYAQRCQVVAVADDTGLEIKALDGLPGVHSKRITQGTDTDRNQFLLEKLGAETDRRARAVTAMAVWDPATQQQAVFEGVVTGSISFELQGEHGFGFDPIFIPDGYQRTQAELTPQEKNAISSRKKALQKVHTYLEHTYEPQEAT